MSFIPWRVGVARRTSFLERRLGLTILWTFHSLHPESTLVQDEWRVNSSEQRNPSDVPRPFCCRSNAVSRRFRAYESLQVHKTLVAARRTNVRDVTVPAGIQYTWTRPESLRIQVLWTLRFVRGGSCVRRGAFPRFLPCPGQDWLTDTPTTTKENPPPTYFSHAPDQRNGITYVDVCRERNAQVKCFVLSDWFNRFWGELTLGDLCNLCCALEGVRDKFSLEWFLWKTITSWPFWMKWKPQITWCVAWLVVQWFTIEMFTY